MLPFNISSSRHAYVCPLVIFPFTVLGGVIGKNTQFGLGYLTWKAEQTELIPLPQPLLWKTFKTLMLLGGGFIPFCVVRKELITIV